ncbi:MAG: hypothetical protein HQL41_11515, partial [Alphaproteobacteria bacterium]|nr:hypothetical protein [Alphaproteobacteria bacterium]
MVAVGVVGESGPVGPGGFRPGMVAGPGVPELPPGPVEPAVVPGPLAVALGLAPPMPVPLPAPMPLPTAGPSELVDENDVGLIEGSDGPEVVGPDKDDAPGSVPVWGAACGPVALGGAPVGEPASW